MKKAIKVLRGLSMISALALAGSITAGVVMEQYPTSLDQVFGTLSSQVVSEETSEADWMYQSKFKTIQEAVEGYKEFAIRESQETYALLKNQGNALPLSKTAKITLMGLRSYTPVYGNSAGSMPDKTTLEQGKNEIFRAFEARGFQLNPSMLAAYESYCATLTRQSGGFGAPAPEYKEISVTDDIPELSLSELRSFKSDFNKDYAAYSDAAIVVVGRPGGESKNYYPETMNKDDKAENDTVSGNVLGLSVEEREIIEEAKKNFDKVIVLVNSTNPMELGELENDKDIDAVMWIGYPGVYGFYGVADVLNGTVSPSAHLGDTFARNTAVNPSMVNFGDATTWTNAADYKNSNVNTYLIQSEGIYSGYHYYETRYMDVVNGVSGAASAAAGTYTNADGTRSTKDGTWNYADEVVYPFGYGLSYTTFSQSLDSVKIMGDKKTAEVTVTVKNTGDTYSGKSVIQLYAQSPYTDYDKQNNVEKSAVQLMDYEKTKTLAPGDSQTITMQVDLSNLASYDYTKAKTYILDAGDYFFAIGENSHDALNNILAAQGKTTSNGMTDNGDAAKTYKWTWADFDDRTFSTSANGTAITNHLTEGDYAMDYNAFQPGAITYLTRSNWNGTYPKAWGGFTISGRLGELLDCDFIDIKTNDDVSAFKWGTNSGMKLYEMKGADWNDDRWNTIVDQVTIAEFLNFAQKAFHNIAPIESVGYTGNNADDGPGGSDTHYFKEGTYQGKAYSEMSGYDESLGDYGTRVAPSPTNLAYAWNKELAFENGEIILGETSLILVLPIIIGPGANLHRHAYNGRGGEYYSEDPILSGYTCSAVVQGAQSKGCLVNIKHAAFNDQEINRSGVAVFQNEQQAREMELKNLRQAIEGNGKPASFVGDESKDNTYTSGALGIMSSYNRIGAVPPSANKGVMVDIIRNEWGFKGYNVTDFTGVSLKASPKESILYGTTAFCGFGVSVDYWNEESFAKDADFCAAIKTDIKYILYALANSNAMNGVNSTTRTVQLMSTWRKLYTGLEIGFGITTGILVVGYLALEVLTAVRKQKEGK